MIRLTLLTVLLAVSTAPAQTVHVVDDDGGAGVDFTDLQDAIDAASDGDILLVKAGSYAGPGGIFGTQLEVLGKGLTINGEVGETVTLSTGILVGNIAAGQSVVLRGLTLACNKKLTMFSTVGPVWVEDVTVPGSCSGTQSLTFTELNTCAQVFFNRCTLEGGGGIVPFAATTSSAMTSLDSGVHMYDCVVQGGVSNGVNPSSHGYKMIGGFLMASGCSFDGGGTNLAVPCGGPGLWLTGTSPRAWLLDTVVDGGEGRCFDALQVDHGVAPMLPGSSRSFVAQSPLRGGEISPLSFSGEPGDTIFLAASVTQGAFFDLGLRGTLQLGVPLFGVFVLGPVPASGQLDLQIPTVDLPPGIDGVVVYIQPGYQDVLGVTTMGTASAQAYISSGF